jgi:hypothetical protein
MGGGYGSPPGGSYGSPPGGGYGGSPAGGYGSPPGGGYGGSPGGSYGSPPGVSDPGYGGSPGGAQMSAPGQFGQAASNLGVYGGGGSMAPGAKGEIRNPVTVCVIGMVCFLYALWQMWAMLNELQQATKDPEFKPWYLFIPFLNYYFLWVKVPEQVTRAKQMAGSRNQQAEGIVLYVFLPLYALAKDLNEVWDPNAA